MRFARYKTLEATVVALIVKETDAKVHIILQTPAVRFLALPKTELRYMTDLEIPVTKKRLKSIRRYAKTMRQPLCKQCKRHLK